MEPIAPGPFTPEPGMLDRPGELDPLIGREEDLVSATQLIAGQRLVTLTGPGGIGKTRLAQAVLARLPDDGTFVDLVAANTADRAIQLIGDALEIKESPELPLSRALTRWLANRRYVLVLDNIEQIADASVLVLQLLDAAPALRVLATSRVPVGLPGEVEVSVRPLPSPSGEDVESVVASPAGALFLRRARAVGRLHTLNPTVARDVARLCRRLDGLPLAIELAASRTRILPPGAILARLDAHDRDLLSRTSGDDRHRSFEAVLDWSIQMLAPHERELLFTTSVCVAGFDLATTEALAAPGIDVIAALETLVAYGLIDVAEPSPGEPRFRQLEPIREIAWERLGPAQLSTMGRFAERMAAAIEEWVGAMQGRGASAALARLDADRPNLNSVLDWTEIADPPLALRLSALAYPYWALRGQMRSSITRLETALARAGEPPSRMSARATGGLSRLTYKLLGNTASRSISETAARLGRLTGDPDGEIEGLQGIVFAIMESGDPDAAAIRSARERAQELIDASDDPARRLRARQVLLVASATEHGFDSQAVLDELGAAIADAHETDSELELAKVLGNRGATHVARRAFREAVSDSTEAARTFGAIGDANNEGLFRSIAAIGLAGVGDGAASGHALLAAYALVEPSESGYFIGQVLSNAAGCAALLGRPLEAARLWGAAEHAMEPDIIPPMETAAFLDQARRDAGEVAWQLAIAEGRETEAGEALRHFAETGDGALASAPVVRLRHGQLTRREVEILRLLAQGRTDTEIAAELFISPKTASVHVSNVKAKLGVETRVDAALMARDMGFGRREEPPKEPPDGARRRRS